MFLLGELPELLPLALVFDAVNLHQKQMALVNINYSEFIAQFIAQLMCFGTDKVTLNARLMYNFGI